MLLALDYDDTYTRDKVFWDAVISLAVSRGHSVICATMRSDNPWDADEVVADLGNKVEKIIFTGGKAKFDFVTNLGYYPSVWIDDSPGFIFNDVWRYQ